MAAPRRMLLADIRASAIAWRVTEAALGELEAATPADWNLVVAESLTSSDGDGGESAPAELLGLIEDAEIYFGFGISRELFLRGKNLRWVHSASAGVGGVLFPEMVASDVLLTNSAGVYGPTIAEHVLAGLLHFLRSFDEAADAQRARRWGKGDFSGSETTMRELAGSSALIVGTGGIGSAIATRLTALGASCTGIRRRPELGLADGFSRVVGAEELDAELPNADLVILAAPATARTVGLLNRDRMALLREGAIVVNVARGSLLDEGALVAAVESGRIRGAVLDVFSQEPLPPTSPLWNQRRVLLTPHVSAVAPASFWRREMALFLENWERYRAGGPLKNLVDKQAGY